MHIHHDKHHQTYVDKLNEALEKAPELKDKSIEDLLANLASLPETVQTPVRNFGGGHYNHSLFWTFMADPKEGGGAPPSGKIAEKINASFGDYEKFKEQFSDAAAKLFGSGYACLALDIAGNPKIIQLKDQDAALTIGMKPILILDVWEHAYYLKYRNKRVDYISAWWNIVNWTEERRLS
jgi:Fe-Mn family superoxide dismutase